MKPGFRKISRLSPVVYGFRGIGLDLARLRLLASESKVQVFVVGADKGRGLDWSGRAIDSRPGREFDGLPPAGI